MCTDLSTVNVIRNAVSIATVGSTGKVTIKGMGAVTVTIIVTRDLGTETLMRRLTVIRWSLPGSTRLISVSVRM